MFVPALVVLLTRAEELKGAPLTRAEVLRIRDEAVCMLVPRSSAEDLEEGRGYPDLHPEQAWEEWREVRTRLGASKGKG